MTTISSTYDDRDRLLQSGSTTFQYDANGNLTARQEASRVTTFEWSVAQRLKRVELPDGSSIAMDYDAEENRVRAVTQTAGGDASTVDYLIDTAEPLSQVVAELAGGQVSTAYTLAGDEELALYRPTEDIERYFHSDVIGTVRSLTDDTGEVSDRYTLEAFGGLLDHEGEDPNSILFAGEHRDPLTGLYYMRSRWMDTEAGRFLGMDPFQGVATAPMSQHPYLYALADPVNNVDSSGRFAVGIGIGLGSIGTLSIGLFTVPAGGSKSPSKVLDCPHGRAPTKIEVISNAISFPRLASGKFRVTAPPSRKYNCIAWTLGITDTWVWRAVDSVAGDKDGVVEISDFDALYERRKLKRVRFFLRHRAEIVLYSLDGEPTHAALNHPCTSRNRLYESKLGSTERIIHKRAALKGPVYGYDLRYYAKID